MIMRLFKTLLPALATSIAAVIATAAQQPPPGEPLIRENAAVKVSDHVYVIPDFNVGLVPNVGIVVGSRATLVVDAVKTIQTEMQARYPGWTAAAQAGNAARAAFNEM